VVELFNVKFPEFVGCVEIVAVALAALGATPPDQLVPSESSPGLVADQVWARDKFAVAIAMDAMVKTFSAKYARCE
jgi:hypothetical protein